MGRQVRLHVLLVAQSATARAIGGPEMRENFSTRILVRYTLNAWRMLVPEVSPIPMPSDHHGRVQVVTRGRAKETQVLNLSNAEAREWAMSGVHSKGTTGPALHKPPVTAAPAADFADAWGTSAPELPPTPATEPPASNRDLTAETWGLTPSPAAATPAADVSAATAATPPAQPAPADDDQALGLREAYDNHLSETVASLDALRRARHDDPEFPPRSASAAPRSSTASATSRSGPATGPAPAPPTSTDRPGPRATKSANTGLSGSADTIPPSWRTPGSPDTAQKRNTTP